MEDLLKAIAKARDNSITVDVDEGDTQEFVKLKWQATVRSWFTRNHMPCEIADWYGKNQDRFFSSFIARSCSNYPPCVVLHRKIHAGCRLQKFYEDSDLCVQVPGFLMTSRQRCARNTTSFASAQGKKQRRTGAHIRLH